MHGVNPRTIKGQEWWDTERKAAAKKYQYHCWACGVHQVHAKFHKWLEGHERYAVDYEHGRLTYLGCCSLCHSCHNFIHLGRLTAMYEQGQVAEAKYRAIIRHGCTLLKTYKLSSPAEYERSIPWADWRLELEGELYPPKFRTEQAWRRYYGYAEAMS